MELRHLETFLAVVRHGSFVRAAEHLGYAQSTVTLHIRELERELRVPVIDRSRRRLVLTEAGRVLETHASAIVRAMRELHETVNALVSGDAGHVRLGAVEPVASARLGPMLVDFCRERPRVRLTFEIAGALALSQRIARSELDAAVSAVPPAELELDFEPLFREPIGLLMPAAHPLAHADAVAPRDLSGIRLLSTDQTCAYRQATERILRDVGVRPAVTVEIASVRALAQAVEAGLGIAILPLAAATPPPEGTVTRRLRDVDLGIGLGFVTNPSAERSSALEAMLKMLRARLASL